ncbi:MAG: DUF2256 domain-containing protein [Bryobacteraceae bacterium]|nr:DUF2256 domain-containing protein [Bryobacteraceae bacterium]
MRGVRKPYLPDRSCADFGRQFTCRKKWARDWYGVRYCSERCRRSTVRYTGVRPDEKGTLQFKAQGRT